MAMVDVQKFYSTSLPSGLPAVSIAHAARKYQAYPGSKYSLPSDDLERQRLLVQQQVLKSLFGNKILFAPVTLGAEDKVLDVGTGPGLWIMDLAESIDPTVQMIGVDIEPHLFPPSPPKNIEFRVESVLKLPADWSDTFSLVHQRLLILALQVHEWPIDLREIYRVLRPGGWVQIADSTPWVEDEYPGRPCMEKLVTLYQRLGRHRNLNLDCVEEMPAMLADAGFTDVHSESRMQLMGKWAGEAGVANRVNHVGVFRGLKTPILEAGGFGVVSSEVEYDELVDGLEREWDEVPGTDKEFIIFWARKPI